MAHVVCLFLHVGLLSVVTIEALSVLLSPCFVVFIVRACTTVLTFPIHPLTHSLSAPPSSLLSSIHLHPHFSFHLVDAPAVVFFVDENVTIRAFVSCFVVCIVSSSLSLSLFALLYVSSTRFFSRYDSCVFVCVSICCDCVSKLFSRNNNALSACVGLCVLCASSCTVPHRGLLCACRCLGVCVCLASVSVTLMRACRFLSRPILLPPPPLSVLRHFDLSAVSFTHCPLPLLCSAWSSLTVETNEIFACVPSPSFGVLTPATVRAFTRSQYRRFRERFMFDGRTSIIVRRSAWISRTRIE